MDFDVRQFGCGFYLEFLLDLSRVVGNCFLPQAQLIGDFLVDQALRQ